MDSSAKSHKPRKQGKGRLQDKSEHYSASIARGSRGTFGTNFRFLPLEDWREIGPDLIKRTGVETISFVFLFLPPILTLETNSEAGIEVE